MQSNRFVIIIIVAALAAIAAYLAAKNRAPQTAIQAQSALVEGLSERVNEVNQIVATGPGGATLVTLDRGDDAWTVAERGGYRANPAEIRKFLLEVADAELIERKTAKSENYTALGVEDVSAADAAGLEVTLGGLGEPVSFVVGKGARGGNAVYVRRSDEPGAWLANRRLSFNMTATGWLDKELIDINTARVQRVHVVHPDGKTLTATRGTVNMEVADLPEGKALKSPTEANALAGVLDDLRFEDVVASTDFEQGEDEPVATTYTTSEGLVVETKAYKVGESYHLSLSTRAQAVPAAPSTEEDAAADEAGAAPTNDAAAMLEAMQSESDELNQRLSAWVFKIPLFKYEQMTHTVDDLIE